MKRPATAGPALLFLPRRFQRGSILRWLKRTHAWMALWGGMAGTLFGLTGILLNHRDILKIPAVESRVEKLELAFGDTPPSSAEEFAAQVRTQLQLQEGRTRITRHEAKAVAWGDKDLHQPARWEVSIQTPQRQVSAEYWLGNQSATVQNREGNAFFWLTRLHKAVGVPVGWVLAADALAGTLLFMTVTGILLWSRLHGPRLLAIGLFCGSLGTLAWFALAV